MHASHFNTHINIFEDEMKFKTAINQERNASGDSALSPDQVSQTHVSVFVL